MSIHKLLVYVHYNGFHLQGMNFANHLVCSYIIEAFKQHHVLSAHDWLLFILDTLQYILL